MSPSSTSENAQALLGLGRVWHKRHRPRVHAFGYPCAFLMLPMRSLREQANPWLNRNRSGWLSFYDKDHGEGGTDALAWLDALLQREGIANANGEVWLHTFPRVLGYAFKPVSFWYAHNHNGELVAVVAEVNNTFGERHFYLLSGPNLAYGREQEARKAFHVSPFCEVSGQYRFRFERSPALHGKPPKTYAQVDLYDQASGHTSPLIQTAVGGDLVPLTRSSVSKTLWRAPLMSFGVMARIHWQALRLWLKRVPFFSKPIAPQQSLSR